LQVGRGETAFREEGVQCKLGGRPLRRILQIDGGSTRGVEEVSAESGDGLRDC
jgi:hypothetical protein